MRLWQAQASAPVYSVRSTPLSTRQWRIADRLTEADLEQLVSAFTAAKKQGGELKLLNLTKKAHDLLQITKLYTVFDVKDDEAAAVKSFSK